VNDEHIRFHAEVMSLPQKSVLRQLGPAVSARQFYLGGGTALAIRLGHRRSLDLDWFTGVSLPEPLRLAADLGSASIPLVVTEVQRGTLHGTADGVRLSFLEYRYPLLQPTTTWDEYGCQLASLDDLAAMKLAAIAQRGSKRDFVDIYALAMKHAPLPDLLQCYRAKYAIQDVGHLLYALVYFADADRERLPTLIWNTDWRQVKSAMRGWVRDLAS
jgi:hypothetical protein